MRGGSNHYLANAPSTAAPAQQDNLWNFPDFEPQPLSHPSSADPPTQSPVTIKIPPMTPRIRRSARQRADSNASGSEYHTSNASMDVDEQDNPDDDREEVQPQPQPQPEFTKSRSGRRVAKKSYKEDSDTEDGSGDELNVIDQNTDLEQPPQTNGTLDGPDEEDNEDNRPYQLRTRSKKTKLNGTVESDDDGHAVVSHRYETRSGSRPTNGTTNGRPTRKSSRNHPSRSSSSKKSLRRARPNTRARQEEEDVYVDEPQSSESESASLDEALGTTPEPEHEADADADAEGEPDQESQQDGRPYAFRQRAKINYAIPPPLEEMKAPPPKPRPFGRTNSRGGRGKAPGWSATGAELSRWMGGDDSDSDYATRTPRKNLGLGGSGGLFAGSAGAGGLLPADLAAAAGTPSNLGKVGEASLADTDPLGVNQNVTFDEVGGLDDYIKALQEMTLLPLLYPEVFQRLGVTPPRGVLFHGPPGTGKTLLARALAASCRANGKGISFFMRKGADCLSKWVGEAERQLRLLFEEAKNSQPSIIFFDEIDGLAPVRSSKQDQIHASIVSTLLALMDGMDGRGQVIVIGATNRPDAVDPALRRPGRFDREFYFPLPNLDARERILQIMTRKWAGWEGEKGEQNAKGLAKLTKGYGGADLRALCTEAALNAIQRRYPQIYKSNERLLLQPETINVELRDFMISVKKLVPSSARATAPSASPLPDQLVPLLQDALDRAKSVVNKIIPVTKSRSALEEAEYEDEGDEGALAREMLMQSMETLRIYRPRIVLHGEPGMGQMYVAAATLHHLESFHVQSLDLGNLMSDATRTPEATIVQLFVEAKRHHPSVLYIPSLTGWCAAVSETARTTVKAMLDSLSPMDPVLLLAVVDGPFSSLPRDVKAWFGTIRENRVQLNRPTVEQREQFFESLVNDVLRPPNHFPDGIKRKKRVLEQLPLAPPLEPRQPTAAELALQEENDQRVITLLKYRLGPILTELKRKFKRFTKRAAEEYTFDENQLQPQPPQVETVTSSVEVHRTSPGGEVVVIDEQTTTTTTEQVTDQQVVSTINSADGISEAPMQAQVQMQPQLFDMDLERMHVELYRSKYLTPDEFLDDIRKIVHNASVRADEDPERLFRAQAMLTAAEVSIQDFDPQFRMECQRMAARESKRREAVRKAREKAKAAEEPTSNGTYAPGTRRSARHNGLEPELAITDPLLLERRLKRQRSAEAAAESEDQDGEGRTSKRSRVSSNELDENEPPGSRVGTPPHRPHAVRFVDDISQKPEPESPTPHANDPVPELPTLQHNHNHSHPSSLGDLLNPIHPEEQQFAGSGSGPQAPDAIDAVANTADNGEASLHPPQADAVALEEKVHLMDATSPSENYALDAMPIDTPSLNAPEDRHEALPASQAAEQEPMEIERTPTPLPDFHVDPILLGQLKIDLRNRTNVLNVEQLEQLRATCLGAVWRHRSEWDRTALLRELKDTVQEFVEEVSLDDMDAGSPQ